MNPERKPESIPEIEQQFPEQWLAIQVTRLDRNRVPVEGILLFHSPDRSEVREKIRGIKEHIFVTFSGDIVPAGWEVILGGNIPF